MCCGFGGTFCVKYPEISDKMVGDKAADIAATGADAVLAGDLGCLLNIAGKLTRKQLVRWAVQQRIFFRPPEFVNQQINSLREPEQVVSGLRVSGQDYRMPTIVDAVTERRLDGSMVYNERRDLYPIAFVDDALANVGCDYLGAFG